MYKEQTAVPKGRGIVSGERLAVGDVVQIRTEHEIMATLDERGELDSLPFMPEMLQFCGRRFVVDKLAFKACDTIDGSGLHRMTDSVHLAGVRCDGSGHGGCQAGCLIYWKTAWLDKIVSSAADSSVSLVPNPVSLPTPVIRERLESMASRVEEEPAEPGGTKTGTDRRRYTCQATELMRAAPETIPVWDLRQYVQDVRSGNSQAGTVARGFLIGLFNRAQLAAAGRVPRRLLIRGGRRYPFIEGRATTSPTGRLDLQPGEWVRVKSKEEIVATLNARNKNRGLLFDAEMLKYCGRQARVLRRVDRIIDEKTGQMLHMTNPCIVLDDVVCTSDYHRSCPRGIYPYWREIWLERVSTP